MKNRILPIIVSMLLLFSTLFTGCGKSPPPANNLPPQNEQSPTAPGDDDSNAAKPDNPSDSNQPPDSTQSLIPIAKLLPLREGYQWVYYGTAEYGHKMVLNKRQVTAAKIDYQISGTVDDMSGGQSGKDHSFTISYTDEKGVITQSKNGECLMDSNFDTIELIRLPLEKGSYWSQKVTDKNGSEITLDCTITDIATEGGLKIYTVYYKQRDSKYYEKRKIKEGVGILYFEKLIITEKESYAVSYSINYALTGYLMNMSINRYLPKLNTEMRYFGLAEYGHTGIFKRIFSTIDEAVYEFDGTYNDGSGIANKFKVQYIINYIDGTVTEKVVSNTKGLKPEVNSRLHDLIILKFPLKRGNTWSQKVKIDGREYTVKATIVEYISSTGKVTVRYTVSGISGYYNNTYIEERTFETGYGMVGFSLLLPGDIGISPEDSKDSSKVEEAIKNHMFGYSLSKI